MVASTHRIVARLAALMFLQFLCGARGTPPLGWL